MSFTILGNQVSDVLQGGQITLTCLFETSPGSGVGASASGVTLGITAAPAASGGSGTPVAPTSAGIASLSESLYQFTWQCPSGQALGDYLATWQATVNGQTMTYVQTVTVAQVPTGSPAPGVYCTVARYQAVTGDQVTPQQIVTANLVRASEDIDHALIGAVYQVNANGMPTDPMLLDVLVRATARQCEYLIADNDPSGVKKQYTSISVGGVSSTRTAASQSPTFPPLAPRAAQILNVAGVLPNAPLISW